ncbi:MAG: (2Fe-2S)-binding protein [Desulfocapsaceae bacterium]|jgi:bacterioferritin-associated ferredoxin|nr:(2Fe-2S)-binding protein [Desulfocapsaceae bacterium]
MVTEEEILARLKPGCICKGIKLHRIIQAIENGATSFKQISQITGIGGGSCGSKRCGQKVAELLKYKENIELFAREEE